MEKKFKELTNAEKFEVICGFRKLADDFENYCYECEIDHYTMDKINGLEKVDYSIGIYGNNYLEIKSYYGDVYKSDAVAFLCSLENVTQIYGASDRVCKQISKCNKLIDTNLFVYETKRLCQMYFDDDIKPTIDFLEDISYAVYTSTYNEDMEDIFECWLDNTLVEDNMVWDEDEEDWIYNEVIRIKRAC